MMSVIPRVEDPEETIWSHLPALKQDPWWDQGKLSREISARSDGRYSLSPLTENADRKPEHPITSVPLFPFCRWKSQHYMILSQELDEALVGLHLYTLHLRSPSVHTGILQKLE